MDTAERRSHTAYACFAAVAPAATKHRVVKSLVGRGFSALWYTSLVAPVAQTNMHRQWHRRDGTSWASPRRFLSFLVALGYALSFPSSLALQQFAKPRMARVAATAVFVNPQTILITSLVVSELCCKVASRFLGLGGTLWRVCRRIAHLD